MASVIVFLKKAVKITKTTKVKGLVQWPTAVTIPSVADVVMRQ